MHVESKRSEYGLLSVLSLLISLIALASIVSFWFFYDQIDSWLELHIGNVTPINDIAFIVLGIGFICIIGVAAAIYCLVAVRALKALAWIALPVALLAGLITTLTVFALGGSPPPQA